MNWKYIFIVVILATVVGGGILTYQYWWLPRQEIKSPEAKPPEEIATDETANWKTYRNNEVGIEFQYPSEWDELTIIEESSKESLSEVKGTKISICKEPNCSFHVSAFTQDYELLAMRDAGTELEYLGRISDRPRLNCSYYELKPCESFAIQGEKAVSVYLPHMGYNSLDTYKAVFIENSDQKFSGIVISQFIKGLTREFLTVEEMIKSKKDYILTAQEALAKSALSAEAQEDLQIFDRIVSTFKFIR